MVFLASALDFDFGFGHYILRVEPQKNYTIR